MFRAERSLWRGLLLLPIWMSSLREQTSSLQRLSSNGEIAKMATHSAEKVRWEAVERKRPH
jgi:hypothetical protein